MKRYVSATLAALVVLVCVNVGAAETLVTAFVEGEHYERLPIAVETNSGDDVEVVEVFSYACVHCFNFDPVIEAWVSNRAEAPMAFTRLPAIFSQDWELMAQAYYTAETLGVLDQVHMPIFEGIHVRREDLRRQDLLAELFATHADVSADDFSTAYNSFSVRSRVQQAKARGRAYRVTGVPMLIVAGKYKIDGRMAGSNTKMLEIFDYVEQQEHAAE